MITYSEFILCNLLRELNDSFNCIDSDTMFKKTKDIYKEFYASQYNNTKDNEIDCMFEFFINSKYIITKFN